MIVDYKQHDEYLEQARRDNIPLGLGLGIDLDNNLRWKRANFNIVLGHANVGKTLWVLWYLTSLSKLHNLKHLINSSENTIEDIKIDVIELYSGKKIKELSLNELEIAKKFVNKHFDFIDTSKLRTLDEFMKEVQALPKVKQYDNLMIDPHNSFLKPYGVNSHDYDYQMASKLRQFAKKFQTTIYLCVHGVTEALRKVHPKEHDFAGLTMPCNSADAEGGGKWVNRSDDFICVHRYISSSTDWMFTDIHVRKVKNTRSGGRPTFSDEPIRFKLNNNKFLCNGKSAI